MKKIFAITLCLSVIALFAFQKKDSVANAMELIEVTVKKDLASKFNILYEPVDIDQKCYLLKGLFPPEAFLIFSNSSMSSKSFGLPAAFLQAIKWL